jgi:hypothetical protein
MGTVGKDVHAALEARRELGPAYEDEIVDSLLAKIDQRLAERKPPERGAITPLLLGSIALGIPITAVALSKAHGAGGILVAIVAWIAIAVANVAVIIRHFR